MWRFLSLASFYACMYVAWSSSAAAADHVSHFDHSCLLLALSQGYTCRTKIASGNTVPVNLLFLSFFFQYSGKTTKIISPNHRACRPCVRAVPQHKWYYLLSTEKPLLLGHLPFSRVARARQIFGKKKTLVPYRCFPTNNQTTCCLLLMCVYHV